MTKAKDNITDYFYYHCQLVFSVLTLRSCHATNNFNRGELGTASTELL